MVTTTPNSTLANEIKGRLSKIQGDKKTLVIESSGVPISAGLKEKYPNRIKNLPISREMRC